MEDKKCHNCGHLLFKAEGSTEAEIICPNCRRINYVGRIHPEEGLRGKDFQAKAIDHNCSKCHRFQFRSIGIGKFQIKCRYCKTVTDFDTAIMRDRSKTSLIKADPNICL